jgi:hypothetical protein
MWISEQTTIISLHSNNWLNFMTELERAESEEWTSTLNRNESHFRLKGVNDDAGSNVGTICSNFNAQYLLFG